MVHVSRREHYRRGDEEIRCAFNDNESLIKANLYRDGELIDQTDTMDTLTQWLTRSTPPSRTSRDPG